MSDSTQNLLSFLRAMVTAWRDDPRDDAELLACFVEARDEAAFKVLVCRHGPLVWRACQRLLGDTPDAEDAFQGAFLALARKAVLLTIKNIPGWLHRVARQIALDIQIGTRRRRGLEQRLRAVKQPKAEENTNRVELYAALDEELAGLPEQLRVPLMLHYLEGKTLEAVARIVGCSRPVVSKRLVRGEAILRKRLERRGLAVGVGSIAVLLGGTAGAQAVPAFLISSTARAALQSLSFPLESSTSAAVAGGVMKTILVAKMKLVTVLLGLTLCLAGGGLLAYQALAGNTAEPPPPDSEPKRNVEASRQPRAAVRVDCYGDPLPAGALVRMGTVRRWYGRLEFTPQTVLAFSPDDKTLVSQNCERADGSVCLWDVTTGKEIRRIANANTGAIRWPCENTLLALSPDGQTLAKVQSGPKGNDGTVCLWKVATGKLRRQLKRSQEPKREAIFLGITFLPNGKILTLDEAAEGDNRIYLWDVATGGREISQLKNQSKGSNIDSQTVAFSRDGKMVAATEGTNAKIIHLWEVATGKKIHQLQLTGEKESSAYSVAFSPDGKTLAAGSSGNGEAICMWEVASGKPIHQFKVGGIGFSCPLAYSPDGKKLVGGWKGHLWDAVMGKEIRSFGWENAKVAVFSPSGKIVAMGDEAGVIRLWEVATGKEILPHKGHHDRVTSIAYSPDGKTLASVSQDRTVRLWEVATGKEIRQLAKHATWTWGSGSLDYSPDGKLLVSMDKAIHLWDTNTCKEIRQFQASENPESVTFSPDGKLLAATLRDRTVCLWQVATGRQLYTLSTQHQNTGNPCSVTFSPDGRLLAVPGKENTVSLWEVANGKLIGQVGEQMQPRRELNKWVRSLAFSPDGRTLGTSSKGDEKICLWEVASGKEICQLKGPKRNSREGCTLAFSPDGRMLATFSGETRYDNENKIYLWEVASGKEIGQLSGHRSAIRCVAFSPDGKTLASGSDDLTCLIWDVASFVDRLKPALAQALPKEQLEAAWTDLAKDPAKAYAAIRALQATPTQAISLLQERMRPAVPLVEPQQLKRWIADLDDDSFTVRGKARREIEKQGELAVPALRRALKDRPALEVKRRLQDLLDELEPKGVIVPPHSLREFRAVQVLESIGTMEARQLLQAWAKGVDEASLTREAQAALARLAKRSAARP